MAPLAEPGPATSTEAQSAPTGKDNADDGTRLGRCPGLLGPEVHIFQGTRWYMIGNTRSGCEWMDNARQMERNAIVTNRPISAKVEGVHDVHILGGALLGQRPMLIYIHEIQFGRKCMHEAYGGDSEWQDGQRSDSLLGDDRSVGEP